jgi:probable rRNA maturation factor
MQFERGKTVVRDGIRIQLGSGFNQVPADSGVTIMALIGRSGRGSLIRVGLVIDRPMPSSMTTPAQPPPSLALELGLVDATLRLSSRDQDRISDRLRQVGGLLGVRGSLRLRVVGDEEMASAHQRYAGVAGTTDVLTFDLSEPMNSNEHGPMPIDADLLICLDEAERQAARLGHAVAEELLLYAIHGLLHCLGHNDQDEASAAEMHAEEDRLLIALGIGSIYAKGSNVGRAEGGSPG